MVRGGNKCLICVLSHLFKTKGIKGVIKGNRENCLNITLTRGVHFMLIDFSNSVKLVRIRIG